MQKNQTNLIEIVVNGETTAIPGGLTVESMLAHLGVDGARVAVELNREIVRKPAWGQTAVEAGAKVEIVQFVGGGSS